MAKYAKRVFLLTLFRFSCNFINFEEENSGLDQDFKSESIELFGALQKHRKITKIEKNNFENLRTLFLPNMLAQKGN